MKRILFRFVLIGSLIAATAGKGYSATYDWVGTSLTGGIYNWNNKLNWQVNGMVAKTIPGASDIVRIAVNPFMHHPTITDAESCASIIFGTFADFTLTVDGVLIVNGTIIQNNDPNFRQHTVLTGKGTITCSNFQLGDNNEPQTTIVNGNWISSTDITLGSGNFAVADHLQNNGGIIRTGSGTLTVSGAFVNNGGKFLCGSGNIIFKGNYTNSGTFAASTGTVYFSGASQMLVDNSSTGTTFNDVTFNGLGTATISAGVSNFAVSGKGVLTLITPARLVAGSSTTAYLTLNSDASGSATVAALSGMSAITGLVNVQHYVHGGNSAYRGYRLLSTPVYANVASINNVISINYLKNSVYLTGTGGTACGFDRMGNPTIYLFRENLADNNDSSSASFRGINNIAQTPSYALDNEAGTFNIPAGNGFLLFFRGNRSTSLASKTVSPYAVPENTTLTTTGILITGQVTVRDWYAPASLNLGYTIRGDTTIRGFNLVGNPYASAINWDLAQDTNHDTAIYGKSIGNTIYVMDPVSKNYGAYTKGTGGVGTHNSGNIIASGQGFFIKAKASTAKLIFNESAKVNTRVTDLLMSKPVDYTNNRYLQLQLAKDSVNTDDIIVHFNGSATQKYNAGIDGEYKPGMGLVSLYSLSSDNVPLAINSLPLPKTSETIGLSATASADGIYQFRLKNIVAVPRLFDVWLMDSYKKDSVNMRETPVYRFSIAKGDTNSFGSKRFKLVIAQNARMAYHLSHFGAFLSDADRGVLLKWQTENEGDYTFFTVERSNDNGNSFKVVGATAANKQGNYSLADKSSKRGLNLYRLKQVDINGSIIYSKVVQIICTGASNSLTANTISVHSQIHKE